MAEDLEKFDLRDICGGLDDVANFGRQEGQTAFPDVRTLRNAIVERKIVRLAEDYRKRESKEAKYRSEHPEEFISAAEFWGAEDVKAIMAKARKL